ncbi:hypothetical protein NGRA_0183 [Nosema granulosis]|uniref:DUF5097 domain-containing protein n=1 Tax=Nosema granulosis TaxID=83296 RepID=A0A9P6H2E9_9MICR|nr:hypothetical protein NGRA_0183 [Nosema granulosis]
MIRDEHLKRYILSKYNKHINKELNTITLCIYRNLSKKFIKNERVVFENETISGRVYSRNKDKYSIFLENGTVVANVKYEDLRRIDIINGEVILGFLKYITVDTPFGIRLLKGHVFDELFTDSNIYRELRRKGRFYKSKDKILKNIKLNSVEKLHKNYKSEKIQDSLKGISIINYGEIDDIKKQVLRNCDPEELKRLMNTNIFHDISPEERLIIEEKDPNLLEKVFKIFSFIKKYCDEKVSSDITLSKLIKSFKEPTYNSEVIGEVHDMLIDNLRKESEDKGLDQLLYNIKSVVDSLPNDENEQEIRRKNDIGLKTWKIKARAFLWDLQQETGNITIYSYYVMLSKKKTHDIEEAVRVRISILEFLISCYFTTNIFRDIILKELRDLEHWEIECLELEMNIKQIESAKQNTAKQIEEVGDAQHNITQIMDIKAGDRRDRLKRKLREIKKKIVYNKTKTDIGVINQARFSFIDGCVYACRFKKFYLPKRETLLKIATFYVPNDKIENVAFTNLQNVIEIIYQ